MRRNRVPILAQKPSNRTMQIVIFIKSHFSLVYKHKLAVFGCIYAISGLALIWVANNQGAEGHF